MTGRYVIVGAGAVGSTAAAQLHLAGFEVVLAARGRHLDALRARGLTYVRPEGTRTLALPAVAGPDEVSLRDGDVLVFATKSQDTEAALQDWAWAPVDGGRREAATALPALMMQNGIDNERAALRRFERVYGCVVTVPATFLHPGEVVARADLPGAFWLGRYPNGRDATRDRLAADLRTAGFAVQVVDDVVPWKVGKLLVNLHNGADALFAPSPRRDDLIRALREEATRVLRAAGIEAVNRTAASTLDLAGLEHQVTGSPDRPAEEWKHSSTWQSLTRTGSVESDFLNGEIVLLARLHGTSAPLNAALQRLVATAPRQAIRPGGLDDADLARLFPLGSA